MMSERTVGNAPVSIVVLTNNEEANIRRCLESLVDWVDEVFVVDSGSTDRTAEIAKTLGAHVVPHPFAGFAEQRNWCLAKLPFSHDWVLFLDADEWPSEDLKADITRALADTGRSGVAGYQVPRRHRFMGRWLRHGGLYPTWLLRLFRHQLAHCESRLVDEHFVVDGPVAMLRGGLLTEDKKGIGPWIDRHNHYASLEAQEMIRRAQRRGTMAGRLLGSQAERKRWLRERVWSRLPLFTRPFVLFVYRYIFRLGFLDGRAGLVYHLLESFWYRLLIDVKYLELVASAAPAREPASRSGSEALDIQKSAR